METEALIHNFRSDISQKTRDAKSKAFFCSMNSKRASMEFHHDTHIESDPYFLEILVKISWDIDVEKMNIFSYFGMIKTIKRAVANLDLRP